MRTRIVRMFCQSKCHDVWVVQKWDSSVPTSDARSDRWDPVRDFEIEDYDKATAFAMDLSQTKKTPTEMAVFEDGKPLSSAP